MANLLTDYRSTLFDLETLTRDIKAELHKISGKKVVSFKVTDTGVKLNNNKWEYVEDAFNYIPYAERKTIIELLDSSDESGVLAVLNNKSRSKRTITKYWVVEIHKDKFQFMYTFDYKRYYYLWISTYERFPK